MVKLQLAAVVSRTGLQFLEDARVEDPGQEVVQHDVLVVIPDEPLDLGQLEARILVHGAIVEAQEQPLELRHDRVLVVPRIPDERPAGVGGVPRQVLCAWVAALERIAEEERVAAIVHVRLIARPTPVDVVQVQGGRPEVHQRVGVVLLLQDAGGIEGDVMVDELGEVRVEGGDAALDHSKVTEPD